MFGSRFSSEQREPQLTYNEYRLLVEQAPIMVWRADTSKKCDYFNRIWLDFTGRTMAQELGDGWAEGVHAADLERCFRIYVSNFDLRVPFEMEYRLKRHDGVYRWIFDRGVPFTDDHGEFLGYIGSCVDVTERVEAQQALHQAAQQEIDVLRGMLSLCTYCKRIRSADGAWVSVEVYIRNRARAEVAETICPQCISRALPLER